MIPGKFILTNTPNLFAPSPQQVVHNGDVCPVLILFSHQSPVHSVQDFKAGKQRMGSVACKLFAFKVGGKAAGMLKTEEHEPFIHF